MTEAMKTLDAGMSAAELEVRASSKALPVTGPACNPDGTPASTSAVSTSSNAAVASVGSDESSPKSGKDQAATTSGQSEGSSSSVVAEAGPSSAEASSSLNRADQTNGNSSSTVCMADQSRAGACADAAQPGQHVVGPRPVPAGTHAAGHAADHEADKVSVASLPASSSETTPSTAPSSKVMTVTHPAAGPQPTMDAKKASHLVNIHASSSNAQSGHNAAVAPPESQAGTTPLPDLAREHRDGDGTTSQSPAACLSLQPAAATPPEQHSPQELPHQASAAPQVDAAGSMTKQGDLNQQAPASSVAPSTVHLAPEHLPQQQAGTSSVSSHASAGKGTAGLQPSTDCSPGAGLAQEAPAWFAQEGHFALMLEEFVVSDCRLLAVTRHLKLRLLWTVSLLSGDQCLHVVTCWANAA